MLATTMLLLAVAAQPQVPAEGLARQIIAEVALQQLRRPSPAWQPAQRDCAGLVRFVYHEAAARLAPSRLEAGLWRDGRGGTTPFADAATLLAHSFVSLGRDAVARAQIDTGDLLAFRQPDGPDGDPVYHLMLTVVPQGAAPDGAWVVYHPGEGGAEVRAGVLGELVRRAPTRWRPGAENPGFLGVFRWKEWIHDDP